MFMIETQETEIPETKTSKSFFLQWVFVCTLGYIIGMASSSLAGEKIGFPLWDSMVSITGIAPEFMQYNYIFATVLMGAVFGGITSLGQWYVLRKYVQNATWWVWIGLLCNLLGNLLICVFPENLSINLFVPVIINASIIGYFESLVLQKSLPLRGWTGIRIAMNTITLIIANINAANYPALIIDRLVSNSLTGLTSGLICGVISGLILNSLINRNYQVLQNEP
jgi:hypothetical protein